jgi:hypothetical protein
VASRSRKNFFSGTWGEAFRSYMTMANEIAVGLEPGELKKAVMNHRTPKGGTGVLKTWS